MSKLDLNLLDSAIELALREDIATGDLTTDLLIPEDSITTATMVAKADGIIAGLAIAQRVFEKLDANIRFDLKVKDGDRVFKGDLLLEVEGSYRALLTGERTALNFLQRVSGIATETAKYVEVVEDYKTEILDTRKTVPCLRTVDKYGVAAGGGTNHRIGLYDMVMIKDNHIKVAGSITAAVSRIKANVDPKIKIEVETTTLEEVVEAINCEADVIMLDNMDNATMKEAVDMIDGRAKVEASGNMSLVRIKEVAETGVDFISIGALTHSVIAFDISMNISI